MGKIMNRINEYFIRSKVEQWYLLQGLDPHEITGKTIKELKDIMQYQMVHKENKIKALESNNKFEKDKNEELEEQLQKQEQNLNDALEILADYKRINDNLTKENQLFSQFIKSKTNEKEKEHKVIEFERK